MLQKERMEQINNKRIMQALEIERDKRESERIVRMQEAALCKEKAELGRKQQQALILRAEILKQVCIINAYVCIVASKLNARMRIDARLSRRTGERERARAHRRAAKDVRGRSGDSCGSRGAQEEAAGCDGTQVSRDEGEQSARLLYQRSETDDREYPVNCTGSILK